MQTTAEALISDLWNRGVQLQSEGDWLAVFPPSRLTDPDRQALRSLKGELLALLNDPYERAGAIARYCEANGKDLAAFLDEHPGLCEPERAGSAALEATVARSPAENIVTACQRRGVALRIDPETGDLVVGKIGAKADEPTQPWSSLLLAIEAHLESVAALVEAGWTVSRPLVATQYLH